MQLCVYSFVFLLSHCRLFASRDDYVGYKVIFSIIYSFNLTKSTNKFAGR